MAILGMNLDLEEQLVFYGAYHSHPLNQAIHLVFVPAIWWTVLVWLAYTPAAGPGDLRFLASRLPAWAAALAPHLRHLRLNASALLAAGYSLYYVALAPLAGLSWAGCVAVPLWGLANWFVGAWAGPLAPWAAALALHLLSWVMQVSVGHGLAERRKPALLDSFSQSLVLAPLFVWFELLFLLGLYPGLHARVQARVRASVDAWKRGQREKRE